MQQIYAAGRSILARPALLALFLSPFLIAAGCIERPTTIDAVPDRPYAGTVLTASANDASDRELLRQLARSWSTRSGAEIRILDGPWDGTADIGLISPAEMPRWAESGQLATVPPDLKSPTHPYRWDDLLPVYTVRLTKWGDQTYALPVLGEGMVLAYRVDAFDGLEGRPGNPPATWDDLAGLGGKYFKDPYLPPLPSTSERLLAEFFTAAACYDNTAVARLSPGEFPGEEFFAFQIDVASPGGNPRLDRPAFRHVAELFRKMRDYRAKSPDAAAAFRKGEAKVGIVSLAELGQMGPDVTEKLGITPLPGARFTFGANGDRRPMDQETINRVPYLGWGGRVGVVSSKCAALAAAWDFLADAGLPDRTALDLIAAPRWGAGPYRASQLDARARSRWYGYGLSAIETERLTSAVRDNLGMGIQNYRLRLRTPNQHELAIALDDELRAMVKNQTPADQAMQNANRRWTEIIHKQPAETWKAIVRKSLGL
jgi:ABC-type glycerol-3-phosphate transport system substrate-binding protein